MAGNSHGHTLAAWTGVTIVTIGFCVAGFFTVVAQPLGVAAGLVLSAAGGVVGMLMRAAGLGQGKPSGRTRAGQAQPQGQSS
ncbi:MAG: HGxxPAAW family protein [Streptomyces sp.]|uniref:HGxxPAAW family protein n=1 Tax=Streptomyces sp. TaxID=1931 RepID=UPI003D6A7B2F